MATNTPTKRLDRSTSARKFRQSRTTVSKKEISGHKFTPTSNPPDSTYQPWYNLTIVIPFKGSTEFYVKTIAEALRAQLDPTKRGMNWLGSRDSRYIVQLRLDSVSCWNLTAGSRMIALSVEDFHDTKSSVQGRDQLCGIIDTGGSGIAPKAGYRLPFSHRSAVLRNDDIEGDISLVNIGVGDNELGIAHFKVLFRFDGPSKLPMIFPDHLRDIAMATQKLVKKAPDTVKIPLLGRASYVIPAIVPVLDTEPTVLTDEAKTDHIDTCPEAGRVTSEKGSDNTLQDSPLQGPSTLDILERLSSIEALMSRLGIDVNQSTEVISNDDSYSQCNDELVDN